MLHRFIHATHLAPQIDHHQIHEILTKQGCGPDHQRPAAVQIQWLEGGRWQIIEGFARFSGARLSSRVLSARSPQKIS